MTQAKKLEALLQKAIDGGWNKFGEFDGWGLRFFDDPIQPRFAFLQEFTSPKATGVNYSQQFTVSDLLFNHDFARALFGEKKVYIDMTVSYINPKDAPTAVPTKKWQYHLQQAVISDNPIDYMYKAVFGE